MDITNQCHNAFALQSSTEKRQADKERKEKLFFCLLLWNHYIFHFCHSSTNSRDLHFLFFVSFPPGNQNSSCCFHSSCFSANLKPYRPLVGPPFAQETFFFPDEVGGSIRTDSLFHTYSRFTIGIVFPTVFKKNNYHREREGRCWGTVK